MTRARAARFDDVDAALAGGRAGVDDRHAARQDRPQHAGRRARRQHVDAAALDQRAVVADAESPRSAPCPSAKRLRPADRPGGSRAAGAASRRGASTGSSRRCARSPSRRKSRTVAAVSVPTSSCASSVDAAMCGVAMTCGSWASDQSAGGSVSNTSRPAPPTTPASMARAQRGLVDQLAARGVDRSGCPACSARSARR